MCVNDARHQIYSSPTTRSWCARLAKPTSPATTTNTGRPQDIAWLDGSLLVADGLGNSRVAKFDRTYFVMAWGRAATPGQFSGRTASPPIAADVYVADHQPRIQTLMQRTFRSVVGAQANDIVIDKDQHVWVADGTN